MFLARVTGRSMERGVPDGSWGLFRVLIGSTPAFAHNLDGKRVLVELRDQGEPDGMGSYTLKRWRVDARGSDGNVEQVSLCPDNRTYTALTFTAEESDGRALRVIAELIEVVG